MNKRKYPYGLDMCPQLKIHVGDKEVANGVMRTSKMSEIYGKYIQSCQGSVVGVCMSYGLHYRKDKTIIVPKSQSTSRSNSPDYNDRFFT